jgi:serine/threonine protein kinase
LGGAIATANADLEARRYRVTAVLGKGGFGKVYRAVLEGPGGFHKDVAIKLLRDQDVPELTLQRFRDEARILGLVRDRAIVSVDPPTRLAGRWAVVMEFVDGASLQRLMSLGPMPPTVAAEIAQEIARVLDKVYRTPGPDGQPLRILHRDIKPANIQVTPDGEVKVLDFGIAKADFSAREAQTSAYVGGTRGFIAPERLEGVDSPAGDVYSLGVTLHFMITGERPTRRQLMGLDEPDTQQLDAEARSMLALASRMRNVEPTERPSARDVEEECAKVRKHSDGPSLRQWAEHNVPRAVALKFSDEVVGSVLTETLASMMPSEERLRSDLATLSGSMSRNGDYGPYRTDHTGGARAPSRTGVIVARVVLAAATLSLVLAVSVSLGVVAAGAGVWWYRVQQQQGLSVQPVSPPISPRPKPVQPVPAAPQPVAAPVEPVPEAQPVAVAPVQPAQPAPVQPAQPVQAAPKTVPKVEPRPEPVIVPGPEPASSDENPAIREQKLTFSSVPLGADVFLDGKLVGRTPLIGFSVPEGSHQVKMVSDSETLVRTIDVGRRNPVRYVWKGGESWEIHF